MVRVFAAAALLVATSASAQVTSYRTNIPPSVVGEPDKIDCKKEEKIGTRLGAKKVCLTVREWHHRHLADREQTELIQSSTRVCANPPCPGTPSFTPGQ